MDNIKPLNIEGLNIRTSDGKKVFGFLLSENFSSLNNNFDEPVEIINYIRNGIPSKAIDNVLENMGVSRAQLSNILHMNNLELNQYSEQEKLSTEQSNLLYEFTRLYVRGLDIFGDKQTVDKWLSRPNLALGEKTPLALLDTIEGFRLVDNLLAQVEYGFYS